MTEAKTTFQVTPAKQFLALVKEANLVTKKVASINGEIGERVRHAIDNAHLHRSAFGLVRKLVRMDEDKRDDFLRSFDAYRDYAVEAQLFGSEHVDDLADMAQRGDGFTIQDAEHEAQRQADADQVAANVEALNGGIKPLTSQLEMAALFERGRIAYLEGKPGLTPDDLVGEPKLSDEYLRGWSSMAALSTEEREALRLSHGEAQGADDQPANSAEPFEDDAAATVTKPSRRGRKAGVGEAGDAPGSYAPVH